MSKRTYSNMNVNPCKMCMPMGGALAFKGIEQSMIIIHGSQGCSTYIRRHIAAHYNEPVDIASSSLTEHGTVYGGTENLKKGLHNIIKLYKPKVIGVLTSCLAETIGEDIQRITREFIDENDLSKVDVIPVHTPGYGATEYEGYFQTLNSVVKYYAKDTRISGKVNVIVSDLTCADIRELKRILGLFRVDYILLPDISETLDAPYENNYNKISKEGTSIKNLEEMGSAIATIEIGKFIKEEYSPGLYLESEFGVPLYRCPVPIGLQNTDELIDILKKITGREVPKQIEIERGRMLDAMIDSHKYNGLGRAAIYGSPELVYSVASLCFENGIKPIVNMTGSSNEILEKTIKEKSKSFGVESTILEDSDFETLQHLIKVKDLNILIGNSDGKFIKEKEDINLIRIGFPVHDHVGAQRKLNIGYVGSIQLLDQITNTLLDIKHENYREDMYKTYAI